MNILVAPDSFKGSLTAEQFCRQVMTVLKQQIPDVEVTAMPLSDGGEGWLGVCQQVFGGETTIEETKGIVGQSLQTPLLRLPDGRIVIEMASSCGLMQMTAATDAFAVSSRGLGEQILQAARFSPSSIVIGIGGTATNDAGMGALHALGLRFFDSLGKSLPPALSSLPAIDVIDSSGLPASVSKVPLVLATDVNNPLIGDDGAIATYGRQKGLTTDEIGRVDDWIAGFYGKLQRTFPAVIEKSTAGSGAGGGIAVGLSAVCPVSITSGFDLLADGMALERHFAEGRWQLLLTGEGCFDDQTANGKLVQRIGRLAQKNHVPSIALVGQCAGDFLQAAALPVDAVIPIQNGPMTVQQSVSQAGELLQQAVGRMLPLLRRLLPS